MRYSSRKGMFQASSKGLGYFIIVYFVGELVDAFTGLVSFARIPIL